MMAWEHLGTAPSCGVDEAGRGPLAGPVVAAAVILPRDFHLPGLDDSKLLSPRKRSLLAGEIRRQAVAWALAVVGPALVDGLNVRRAAELAMLRAVTALSPPPELVLVDGSSTIPGCPYPQEPWVKGDRRVAAIAAASILAKVYRDGLMEELSLLYPGYGFEVHRGYPTPAHREALQILGPTPLHRRSFRWFKMEA